MAFVAQPTPMPLARRGPESTGEPVHIKVRAEELSKRQKRMQRQSHYARRIEEEDVERVQQARSDADLGERRDKALAWSDRADEASERDVSDAFGVQGDDSILLGPFYARDEQDIQELRRQIGIEAGDFLDRRAARNAIAWLEKRNQGKYDTNEVLRRSYVRRQTEEEERCFVGNEELSCYPSTGTRINQGQYGKLIWNQNYPEFTNRGGYVDIYLFHEDTDRVLTSWTSVDNGQGRLTFQPGDSWWQGRRQADQFNGTSIAWPFYFVITYAGAGLGGTTHRLSTWFAVQTATPLAVISSMLSASLASQSSLAASSMISQFTTPPSLASETSSFASSLTSALVSELQSEGLSGTQTLQSTATTTLPNGDILTAAATGQANGKLLPPSGEHHGLPHYAIALITVFGFIALSAMIVGLYFGLAAARRQRRRLLARDYSDSSHAESNAPMMANFGSPGSLNTPEPQTRGEEGEPAMSRDVTSEPTSPGVAGFAAGAGFTAGIAAAARRARSRRRPQSMSVIESLDDEDRREGQQEGFSSNDASRLAAAFRAVLRRPHFTSLSTSVARTASESRRLSQMGGNGSSGHSGTLDTAAAAGEQQAESDNPDRRSTVDDPAATALLQEELGAEGREMQKVEQKRPEVHRSSDRPATPAKDS